MSDANLVDPGDAPDTSATDKTDKTVVTPPAADGGKTPADKPAADTGKQPTTIADGKAPAAPPAAPANFPDNWRQLMAKDVGGADEKAVAKELKRLERYASPSAVYAAQRELEAKFSAGGLAKVPGPKATDEERAAFHKALGVPEKPEEYLDKIKLSNDRVLGDNDKPIFTYFAERLHKKGATPEIMSELTDAWLDFQIKEAADRDANDDRFMQEQEGIIAKEWGGAKERNVNAIGALFDGTPGGAEIKDIFLNGRDANGNKLGNNVAVLNFLANLGLDHFPQATVVTSTGASASDRLAEIRKFRAENPDKYDADQKMQAEELELIEADLRAQKRGKAA